MQLENKFKGSDKNIDKNIEKKAMNPIPNTTKMTREEFVKISHLQVLFTSLLCFLVHCFLLFATNNTIDRHLCLYTIFCVVLSCLDDQNCAYRLCTRCNLNLKVILLQIFGSDFCFVFLNYFCIE